MKDLIIKTVDIMVIAFVVIITLTAFVAGIIGSGFFSGLLAAVVAFVLSAMMAGSWIILTRIHDRLKSIDESIKLK